MSHYLWEMRPYFRQVAGQLVLGSVNGIIMNTAVVLPAILLGRAIDTALALFRGEATGLEVTLAALFFVGGTLATEVPRIIKRWWLMTANGRIRANLRADALRGVFAWPMERIHRTPVGDLMARIIGDVEVLGVGVREFTIETWDTVLFSISLVVAMFVFDSSLTLMSLLPVPFAFILAHASGRWVANRTTAAREANSALTSALQESISGVRLLRLFGRAPAAVDRVADLSRHQADANLAVVRLRVGLQPIYASMVMAGVVLVLWQGGLRVIAGAMTVGALVAYLQLYLRFVERGYRIPQLVNSIQRGGAAYQRLRPLLAPPLSVRGELRAASFRTGHIAGINHPATLPHADSVGPVAVTVERASFRYPGAATLALEDVSLEIPAGALVAVTGPVGSGKSALARALVGLYPLESGAIRLDGRPVDTISSAERAAHTGYLPQDSYLFSGTIRDNILFGFETGRPSRGSPDGNQAYTERAVAVAALKSEISSFVKGMETEIGELGVRVSGGQRQRIALARALAASAPSTPGLLVLDDPFSSVDVDTEAQIVAGLKRAFGPLAPHKEQATIVLFSHRLAAFAQADVVVVLDRGRIVERGSHLELLRAGGLYHRIFRAQSRLQPTASTPDRGEVAT